MNVPLLLLPKITTAYITADATVGEGIKILRQSGFTAVPVLYEDGRYCGTVSTSDVLGYLLEKGTTDVGGDATCVCEILPYHANPAVNIDASLGELIDRLMDSNFVPVVDGRGCFVGIVTRKKLLTYLKESFRETEEAVAAGA